MSEDHHDHPDLHAVRLDDENTPMCRGSIEHFVLGPMMVQQTVCHPPLPLRCRRRDAWKPFRRDLRAAASSSSLRLSIICPAPTT